MRVCRASSPGAGIFNCREKLQVAAVGRFQQFAQSGQTVNGFLHGCLFGFVRAVAMFYLSVVLEKSQIVDRGLHPQDEAELVVELDRHRPHRVFNPRAFDADVESVFHLAFVLRAELAPQESSDVVRFDRVHRRARQVFVNGPEIGLFAEHDVGGVLALIHAPVLTGREVPQDGTVTACELIQPSVDPLRFPAIGDALCPLPVRDVGEGVVGHSIVDAEFAQLTGQPVVIVEANLQTAGQPRRNPHMAQTQILVMK